MKSGEDKLSLSLNQLARSTSYIRIMVIVRSSLSAGLQSFPTSAYCLLTLLHCSCHLQGLACKCCCSTGWNGGLSLGFGRSSCLSPSGLAPHLLLRSSEMLHYSTIHFQ